MLFKREREEQKEKLSNVQSEKGFQVNKYTDSPVKVQVDMDQVMVDIENALLLSVLNHLPHLQYYSVSAIDSWEAVATDVRNYAIGNFNYSGGLFTAQFMKEIYFKIENVY